eukprot:m.335596 g.335596  ORF g.335596 m.335596 type:complete len:184 (+) comp17635_c0_seq1:209-760(+)
MPLPGILERPISRGRTEINLSTFAFLMSEIIQYSHKRSDSVPDLERRLAEIGGQVGHRVLELLCLRERTPKREIKLNNMLLFIHTTVWKSLFGKQADLLEKDSDRNDTYMISDSNMVVNRFVSVPRELGSLNCAAFVAGIVEAILEGAHFPAKVTAHSVAQKGTTFLIKFDLSVLPPEALDTR